MPKKQHNAVRNRLNTKLAKQFKQRKCSNCGIKLSPHEVDDICNGCHNNELILK